MASIRKEERATDNLDELWASYRQSRSQEARNRLAEHYLHLVRYHAERIATRLPHEVDVEDLVSAGFFGLLSAIDAFDPRRGFKFATFCSQRIRGAILDELRKLDWVPRLTRTRAQHLEAIGRQLEMELGRTPCHSELARRMRLTDAEFLQLLRDATTISVGSLSRSTMDTRSSRELDGLDILPDQRSVDPIREALRRDIKDVITRGLNRAERLVILLYYYEDLTMREIGSTLDLSESRVSQLHSAVLERLKEYLVARHSDLMTVV